MSRRQEIATLRQLVEERDRLYTEQRKSDEQARKLAAETIEYRLVELNGLRHQFGDLVGQMITRREHDGQLSGLFEKLEQHRVNTDVKLAADYEPLRAKIEALGRPNYAVLISAIGICFGLVTGGWFVMNLQINDALSPVQTSVEQNKVALAAQSEVVRRIDTSAQASAQSDQVSRVDRAQLNDRVRQFEATQASRAQAISDVSTLKAQYQLIVDRLQQIRTENTKQGAALIEVETQFCSSDIMRNLQQSNNQRIVSMLWRQVFKAEYPISDSYYPMICNRAAQPNRE